MARVGISNLSRRCRSPCKTQLCSDWQSNNCWLVLLPPCVWICESIFCCRSDSFDIRLHFEWQQQGNPHIHSIAWWHNAQSRPDIWHYTRRLHSISDHLIKYVDALISTGNQARCSNIDAAPHPVTDPHVSHKPYSEVEDFEADQVNLVATCQHHTCCSAAYCLRNRCESTRVQVWLSKHTSAAHHHRFIENDEMKLLMVRNNDLVNAYNLMQQIWTDIYTVLYFKAEI